MLKRAAEIEIRVNGRSETVTADPATPLLYILRNDLALNGPKFGCGLGECGACAVLVGDRSMRSCTVPVGALAGRAVTTLEGLARGGEPHPVQAAFVRLQAAQCGYCLNGMIIAAVALLRRDPDPDEAAIRAALRHHLCRCGTHLEILAAVRAAAAEAAPPPDGAPPRDARDDDGGEA
ncbi:MULTISPECIES: (2Fe-2S)-binding protein [unclassified Aureimonas]|uniref:(2Fe-2S)-binding protein n=1 Tax=unclassified Aureimonas TaxID=2615206 RepID=UPI0006F83ED0|nr:MULTISPECIES: (2Fe-2S)-binding protein [unclassified Aureimonas]KQT55212.1 (2Fe-2S)-binding protein [Aureimonas sp. Leaf427]KQT71003.1 (2Fe-2S)-binding protein [Aureimonas sp. Leaf460]